MSVRHLLEAAGFCLLAAVALAAYGVNQQPLHGDNAYLMYMGVAVYRGESLYNATTFGYPPIGPLVSASAMHIGSWAGFPPIASARYASLVLSSVLAGLVYLIALKMTGKRWIAAIASMVLSGFELLGLITCTNLDPKVLLSLLMSLAMLSLIFRRWTSASLLATLALFCWQPALIVLVTVFVVALYSARTERKKALTQLLAGIAIGSLPVAVYLSLTHGWQAFLRQSLMNKAIDAAPSAFQHPLGWATSLFSAMPHEQGIVVLAGAAVILFVLFVLRTRDSSSLISADKGGLPLLTALWICFSSLHLQGWNDLAPFFPLVALWCAWLAGRFTSMLDPRALRWILPVAIAGTALYCYVDAFRYAPRYTLTEETRIIDEVLQGAPQGKSMLALGAEEFYIVANQKAYWKYLRLDRLQNRLLDSNEEDGCNALLSRWRENPPGIVIVREINPGDCQETIEQTLLSEYRQEVRNVPARRAFQYKVYYQPQD